VSTSWSGFPPMLPKAVLRTDRDPPDFRSLNTLVSSLPRKQGITVSHLWKYFSFPFESSSSIIA
jgi:hypothetical protein